VGFKLGTLLGKVASGVIGRATGGAVKVNFQRPSSPSIVATADSVVTQRGFLGTNIKTTTYGQTISSYPVSPPPQANGGGGAPAGHMGCSPLWDGTRFRATHPNKATYVTRGGGTSRWPQQLIVHPKGTECVTRRKLNPGNGRAALRAVRRLTAFYSLSQRVAKQLRRAASKAHIGGAGRGRRQLSAGRSVEVVNVE